MALADGDPDTKEFLEYARFGELENICEALQKGFDVDCKGAGDVTALHMASANGHINIAQLLLDKGAAIDCQNQDGNTPLHWACLNSQIQIAKTLLEAGANPAMVNSCGSTPLDAAMQQGSGELVDLIKLFGPQEPKKAGAED